MSEASNIKAAQEVHHQYEFYFTGLAFTLAVLAIQTLAFCGNIFIDATETIGIISIVLAGGIGLYRIQQFPTLYRLFENVYNPRSGLNVDDPVAQEIRNKLKKDHENISSKNWHSNKWQRVTFIIGVVAILISRVGNQFVHTYCNDSCSSLDLRLSDSRTAFI